MTRFNPSNMFGGLRGRFDPLTTKIATRKKDSVRLSLKILKCLEKKGLVTRRDDESIGENSR